MKNRHIYMVVGFLFLMMGAGLSANAQSPGLPKYVDTGNPTLDAANYAAQKTAWVKAHPEEYKAALANAKASQQAPSVSRTPSGFHYDANGVPQKGTNPTPADMEKYAAAKAEFVKRNNNGAVGAEVKRLPDYPRFTDTGNPEADMKRYNDAKAAFNAKHAIGQENSRIPKPVYKNTGNPEKDLQNYNNAKAAYNAATLKQNP